MCTPGAAEAMVVVLSLRALGDLKAVLPVAEIELVDETEVTSMSSVRYT